MSEALRVRYPSTLTIAGGTFHSLVLCAALFLTATISSVYYSLLFLVMLLIYVYAFGAHVDRDAARVLRPVIGMMLLGIIFSFNNDVYDALKDVWYAGKAIVCFLLGYHIARKITDTKRFFNLFVRLSFLMALIYLVNIFRGADDIGIETVSGIGGLSLISALAVPLLLFRKTGFVFKGTPVFKALIVSTVTASFALSFSRTSIGCFLILIFAGAGLFDNIKKSLVYVGLAAILVILIAPMLPNLDGQITFLGKLKNSFNEIALTTGADASEMLTNWRGFEAYRAYMAFINSSIPQQLVGRGWGATVDLGFGVQMSESLYYRYLPILHNGYMQILTKYGLLGVFLYFVFLWRVTIGSRKYFIKNNNAIYARFITGLGLVLVYTSLVITGILNKGNLDGVLILVGLLFGSAGLPFNNPARQQPILFNYRDLNANGR